MFGFALLYLIRCEFCLSLIFIKRQSFKWKENKVAVEMWVNKTNVLIRDPPIWHLRKQTKQIYETNGNKLEINISC